MLSKEDESELERIGINVKQLVDAYNSESETKLQLPKLITEKEVSEKYISTEDKGVFGDNRYTAGKNVVNEIYAKKIKKEFGIDIVGKEIDDVLLEIKSIKGSDSGKTDQSFIDLQKKYSNLEEELENTKKQRESEVFLLNLSNDFIKAVPDKTIIPGEDLVDLYTNRHQFSNDSGNRIVSQNQQVIKDKLENPVDPVSHFKEWLDVNGYMKKDVSMTGDSSSMSPPKFGSTEEAVSWMEKNNIEPMSAEGINIINENRV